MAGINIATLPTSVQKKIRFRSILRIITMVIAVIGAIWILIYIKNDAGITFQSAKEIFECLLVTLLFSAMPHGCLHSLNLVKKVFMMPFPLGIILAMVVFAFCGTFGFVFFFIDLVLLILRKPLVYKGEINDLMSSSEAMSEAFYESLNK